MIALLYILQLVFLHRQLCISLILLCTYVYRRTPSRSCTVVCCCATAYKQHRVLLLQRTAQSQLFDSITENFNSGIEDEQKSLEQRLLEQQRQSEEDSRWLAREEVRSTVNFLALTKRF